MPNNQYREEQPKHMSWKERCERLEAKPTLQNFFEVLCSRRSDVFAVWLEGDTERTYDYAHLYERSFACAGEVIRSGFGAEGGRVGVAVDTCPDWAILFWGLLAAGRVPLLLDPSLPDAQLAYLMRQAGAAALLTRKRRSLDCVQKAPEELLNGGAFTGEPRWSDNVAVCTSGTTSTSRVFVYNGAAICRQAVGFMGHQFYPCITCEESGPIRTLSFLPLNHIFGLMTNIICTPIQSCPQVYLKDRAPQTILETCRKCRVEMILCVPLLANGIAAGVMKEVARQSAVKRFGFRVLQELSLAAQELNPRWGLRVGHRLFRSVNAKLFGDSLLQIVVGGARMPKEYLRTLNALGYAVTVGYGMTEIAITSYENKIDLRSRMTGSVGLPLPICEYKLRPLDEDKTRGELLVRCNAMHVARLSEGKMIPPELDADGWFATGDVVHLGAGGRMWIEGRVKDVIIGPSGENVYPDEVEEAFTHLTGVTQLCVLGAVHDGREEVTLTMVPDHPDMTAPELETLYRQFSEANTRLRPNLRVRRALLSRNPLPVAATIKVRRLALRDAIEQTPEAFSELTADTRTLPEAAPAPAAAAPAAAAPAPAAEKPESAGEDPAELAGLRDTVRGCFAQALYKDESEIGDDDNFFDDLGGDSLASLDVAVSVQDACGVRLPEDAYSSCLSVNDLARLICRLKHGEQTPAEAKPAGETKRTPITRFEDTPEYAAFQARLSTMEEGRNPYFVAYDSPLRDTSLRDGKQILNFGSYNYVGMSGRKETVEAAKAAAEHYGTSASGSRLLGGEKPIHEELERELAAWKHAEDALVLVGGHSTNVTFVGNFCGEKDLILYDVLDHNSIQEGCRLSRAECRAFPHNNPQALESILRLNRDSYEKVLIAVEGVYSMDGDIAPIPEYVRLKKQYGCFLMVDEAHSACVLGATGGGVDEYFGLDTDDIDVKMGTLSKGLGTCGGYLAGRRALIEYLRYNLPGFVFSVGISPPLAAASLTAIRLLQRQPEIMEALHRNIRVFMEEAHKRRFNTCLAGETAILPILVGADEDAFRLSTALLDRGVFAPPAVYPAVPKNKARLRFCVISEHKPEQIVQALDALADAANALNIHLPE